jgi:lactose/L-arabinose transport system permease protein
MLVMSFISLFPFYWMVVSSTNSTSDINIGKFTFGDQLLMNFNNLVGQVDLPLIFWNTSKIALINTLATLVICSMAGYAFEIYKSKTRERVYVALLSTMMIPFAALMIPLFTMFAKANLLDTHFAVILPTVSVAFIIFYFRQATKSFPKELIDAARVEGVVEWKIFLYIYVPIMRPSYSAAFIIVFMNAWNAFLWPLIVLQTNETKTINLVISSFASAYVPDFGLIMVGTVISTIPSLFIFFAMQKQFVASLTGAVK